MAASGSTWPPCASCRASRATSAHGPPAHECAASRVRAPPRARPALRSWPRALLALSHGLPPALAQIVRAPEHVSWLDDDGRLTLAAPRSVPRSVLFPVSASPFVAVCAHEWGERAVSRQIRAYLVIDATQELELSDSKVNRGPRRRKTVALTNTLVHLCLVCVSGMESGGTLGC